MLHRAIVNSTRRTAGQLLFRAGQQLDTVTIEGIARADG